MTRTSRLYDANLYRFDQAQPSYWEATAGERPSPGSVPDGDVDCDVAIIGGGYTGLSAALHIAREGRQSVRVLEAGHIGWGASGRNGGFCTIGGTAADNHDLLARYGEDEVRRYYRSQCDAVELVRSLLDSENIDAAMQGDCELEVAHSPGAWQELQEHAKWQRDTLGLDCRTIDAATFRNEYFDASEQCGAAAMRPTFGLHPLRYHLGLAAAAARQGAVLHPHSEVVGWSKDRDHHRLTTAGGTVTARRVIVATNGFVPEHLHPVLRGQALPVISAIIVTRPLTDDELAAYRWQTECTAINSRRLLNYFRLLPDRRLLFGGRGHSNGDAAGCERTFASLVDTRNRLWPEWRNVGIDYSWCGLICMTRRRTPVIARASGDPTVFLAMGYHGNGVNTSTWSGRELARWVALDGKSADDFESTLPAMVRGVSPGFPLPALRLWYLKAALAWYAYMDRRA